MSRLMPRHLQSVSLALLLWLVSISMHAKCFSIPEKEGEKCRYAVQIDFKKAYISGIGILMMQDGIINGTVFNEFGVSALSFTYNPEKGKVKLQHVFSKLNKWYIKKVLKRDLVQLIKQLQNDQTTYRDERFDITYNFSPLQTENETTE